jgi:protease-4
MFQISVTLLASIILLAPNSYAGDATPTLTTTALESGPGALWVNPANIAFDPDLRYGFWTHQNSLDQWPTAIATAFGFGSSTFGFRADMQDGMTTTSIDYAKSVSFSDVLNYGTRISWNTSGETLTSTSFEMGLSYRPKYWYGLSFTAANLGKPLPSHQPRITTGIALRPIGQRLSLGADTSYTLANASDGGFSMTEATFVHRGVMQLQPREGLYLHASLDSSLAVWSGLSFYFGGAGGGLYGNLPDVSDSTNIQEELRVTSFIGSSNYQESVMRTKKIITLTLSGEIPYTSNPSIFSIASPTWLQTMKALNKLPRDRSVKGAVVRFESNSMSWANAREMRRSLLGMKAAGKPVIAYFHGTPTLLDLYVASAAEHIVGHPAQSLYITGIAGQILNFGGTLDKIGVSPEFIRRSEYKSAVEQYTATQPSAPSLEQTNALLDDLFNEAVKAIANGRNVSEDKVRNWIDAGPHTPTEALGSGLIDTLAYTDEIERITNQYIGDFEYRNLYQGIYAHNPWPAQDAVGLITIEGGIMSGRSSGGGLIGAQTTGSDTIVAQLRDAKENTSIKAIVIRVDSPGGSAFASEEIHREIELVQESGKPVVISMGGVAASGGYYVASGADTIWAEPNTITGSIGVYGGKFALDGLYEKLDLGSTVITRGDNAAILATTAWSEGERARMNAMIDDTYLLFKTRVSEGRGLSLNEVEELARGRVWSGAKAHKHGLVDQLGGLTDAIGDAISQAGVSNSKKVRIIQYGSQNSSLGLLSSLISMNTEKKALQELQPLKDSVRLLGLDQPLLATLLALQSKHETVWLLDPNLFTVSN